MTDFTDRVVIVTGAGTGIGAGIARRFGRDGATVILAGRGEDKLKTVAADIGERAHVCVTDVSKGEECDALVAHVRERFGRIDVLVNNAGVDHIGAVDDGAWSDFTKVIETNLYGTVRMTRAAIAALRESKGSIVNMSSVSGLGGDWMHSFYCTSKGAITNFTRAVAMDEARNGVRVNAVNPSLTYTPLTEDMKDDPELIAKFEERIPMGRGGQPDDVAGVVAFLASDDARFVTGVNLPVDGGLSASNGQPPLG